jgi:hypothetical protein
VQSKTAIVVGWSEIGLDRQGLLIPGERLTDASERELRVPSVIEGVDCFRGKAKRSLATRNRLFVPAPQVKHIAPIGPDLRRREFPGRQLVQQFQCLGQASLATTDNTKQMQRIGLFRKRLQNSDTQTLGLLEPSSPIGLGGAGERFRQ